MARARKRSKKRNTKVATLKRTDTNIKTKEIREIRQSLDICLVGLHEQQLANQTLKTRLLEVRAMIQKRLLRQPGMNL